MNSLVQLKIDRNYPKFEIMQFKIFTEIGLDVKERIIYHISKEHMPFFTYGHD